MKDKAGGSWGSHWKVHRFVVQTRSSAKVLVFSEMVVFKRRTRRETHLPVFKNSTLTNGAVTNTYIPSLRGCLRHFASHSAYWSADRPFRDEKLRNRFRSAQGRRTADQSFSSYFWNTLCRTRLCPMSYCLVLIDIPSPGRRSSERQKA